MSEPVEAGTQVPIELVLADLKDQIGVMAVELAKQRTLNKVLQQSEHNKGEMIDTLAARIGEMESKLATKNGDEGGRDDEGRTPATAG